MNHLVRTVVFWMHLAAGVTAGSIVAVMAVTGAALAFQPQLLEWAERDSRASRPPRPDAPRLRADDLLARARAARPAAAPTALTVHQDPASAVRVSAGRAAVHVDPFTGEVREVAGQRWRDFFQAAVTWHRYLGTEGDGRAVGKAITGVCNAAFLFLALSGLYLWLPRKWIGRATNFTLWFRRGLAGKARDFNWHNVIGFWCAAVLVVVTLSGMMISYRWVSNLILSLPGPGAVPPPAEVPPPPKDARPMPLEALLASARGEVPGWSTITVRFAGAAAQGAARPQPVAIAVKERAAWPRTATTQLALDPYTARVLRKETHEVQTRGRRVRTWLRFLHTGEALGWPGQLVAGVASLGAAVLVWTGVAMAVRRLVHFRRRRRALSAG